ncbi:hypothetical protein [Phaeobacter italicus]|nr:hypothetical protein [Phaeobacter italicus]MCA0855747.1 hypothetical protein [Phaeobacter italicus]
MGSIMVYRYRPMRMVPTITTRVFIALAPLSVEADLMTGGRGRQQAKEIKTPGFEKFSCVSLLACDIFRFLSAEMLLNSVSTASFVSRLAAPPEWEMPES